MKVYAVYCNDRPFSLFWRALFKYLYFFMLRTDCIIKYGTQINASKQKYTVYKLR